MIIIQSQQQIKVDWPLFAGGVIGLLIVGVGVVRSDSRWWWAGLIFSLGFLGVRAVIRRFGR